MSGDWSQWFCSAQKSMKLADQSLALQRYAEADIHLTEAVLHLQLAQMSLPKYKSP